MSTEANAPVTDPATTVTRFSECDRTSLSHNRSVLMSKPDRFRTLRPHVTDNPDLRDPQREAFAEAHAHYSTPEAEPETAIILPVGCGKSGLITLLPFATAARRALVVAPNLRIYQQLAAEFEPSNPEMFYLLRRVLPSPPYPEPVPIRESRVTRTDLDDADVVIANIQQLQNAAENKWLQQLPSDFFDLIIVDEAHHNVATSWTDLRTKFPTARVINLSATPQRADGQVMTGRVIYSYPVFRAIQAGLIKRLTALVLNPTTLRYVRNDGQEIEIPLEEVRRLGEEEADFRRSVVTSKETLTTIVDASIRALERRRTETQDARHKIIAAALNQAHCIQVVEAYRARNIRADYVHSNLDSSHNERILKALERHELDVIVQARMLGEGFDHRYLSVAAVFALYRSLSPFVQFVGRIMRSLVSGDPSDIQNRGVVVFHAGANVARRWDDFRQFSEADQEFFDQLLPTEELRFADAEELAIEPRSTGRYEPTIDVRSQDAVLVEELPLLSSQEEEALRILGARFQVRLTPVPTSRFREKQAALAMLDPRVKTEAQRLLLERGVNPNGRELDRKHLDRTNFVVMKTAIDRQIANFLGRKSGERQDLSREEYDRVNAEFGALVRLAEEEVFHG